MHDKYLDLSDPLYKSHPLWTAVTVCQPYVVLIGAFLTIIVAIGFIVLTIAPPSVTAVCH